MNALEIKRHILKICKYAAFSKFSKEFWNEIEVKLHNDYMGDVCLTLIKKLAAEEHIENYDVYFEFPLNWWQMFKRDVMPKWYKKIYPIKTKHYKKTVEFIERFVFPNMPIKGNERLEFYYRKDSAMEVDND